MKNKLMANKDKILALFLSLVVAFGLWLYVITVVNPEYEETYVDIPVVLQNKDILTERGLMVSGDLPTVTLVLRGDRATLNSLNKSNINVFANVANIDKPGTHQLTYSVSYPSNVPPNTVSTQSGSTDLITLKVENLMKKQVPVEINYNGTTAPNGFVADTENVYLDYTVIDVSGPESVVSRIQKAEIQVNLTNMTNTLIAEYGYTFLDAEGLSVSSEGLTTNTGKINLMLKIFQRKEINLGVNVNYGGGITATNSTYTMSVQKLWVSGTEAQLSALESLLTGNTLIVGEIDFAEMKELQNTFTFDIELPDGVNNVSGYNQVTVEFEIPNLSTKTIVVRDIDFENKSSNLTVEIYTKVLIVTVRGSADLIDQLTANDLQASVNLSGLTAGERIVNAEITVDADFAGVGVIGTYPVTVELKSA